jgi:hypothetical protein
MLVNVPDLFDVNTATDALTHQWQQYDDAWTKSQASTETIKVARDAVACLMSRSTGLQPDIGEEELRRRIARGFVELGKRNLLPTHDDRTTTWAASSGRHNGTSDVDAASDTSSVTTDLD